MALGINDLTPISAVTAGTKFEGVGEERDQQGRLGRRVTGAQIEVFINRAGGAADKNIDTKVKAETDRAKETEGSLQNLATATKANLVAAVNEVNAIAKAGLEGAVAANEELPNKANKIITEQTKTLAGADVGDVLGVVTFGTGSVPAPPGAAGNIIFTDGSRFDLAASGNMTHTGAGGAVTEIITGGVWVTASVDTGTAAIQSEANANSGAWLSGTWVSGQTAIDLADVKVTADGAAQTANEAAAAVVAEALRAVAAESALGNNKVDKLTGETGCDYIYAKRAGGGQGYQELWTEPVPNSIPSRDDGGALYAQPGTDDSAVVVNAQLNEEAEARDTAITEAIDAEAEARDTAIGDAISQEVADRDEAIAASVKTTLQEQDASSALPPVTEYSFATLLQLMRNNLKWLRDNSGGGTAEIDEALPPLLADRDGFLVAARGGTLIELNIAGQAA